MASRMTAARALAMACALITACALLIGAPQAAVAASADAADSPALQRLAPTLAPGNAVGTLATGVPFTAPITHVAPDGGVDQVICRFKVTDEGTCMVVGGGTRAGVRAVDPATEGAIEIPATVEYDGATYAVTAIGPYAFGATSTTSCTLLTSVKLPSGINELGTYAFAYCDGLASIELPDSLKTIGTYAFYYAEGLTSIEFPASVKSLEAFSFAQANGLKTVRFLGDAPEVALASFTGGTTIEAVVFDGAGLASTASRFNSKNVDQPTFYYTVSFYPSSEDASAHTNLLGRAQIGDNTPYRGVVEGIAEPNVWSGSVPTYPDGMNIWRFSASADRNQAVGARQDAWAEFSDYRNLTKGAVSAADAGYSGVGYSVYNAAPVVTDLEGAVLAQGVDYTLKYQRQVEGVWEDFEEGAEPVDPGTYRAIATGRGAYLGQVGGEFEIVLKVGAKFAFDCAAERGGEPLVPCTFQVTSFEDGVGTVQPAARDYTQAEIDYANETGTMLPAVGAIEGAYNGPLVLPEKIELFGCELAVTAVPYRAFHWETNSAAFTAKITAVDIPATVTKIEGEAFAGCPLERIVFRNDLSSADVASNVFKGCSSIRTVVYLDKKLDDSRFNPEKFYNSGTVHFYYTVRFYYDPGATHLAGSAEPSQDARFLGQATISDDLLLGLVPDRPGDAYTVFEGEIPAYPGELIDDAGNDERAWYAPGWSYPELDEDADAALRSTLSDSVNAFAEQRQDAFTIADANVIGIDSSYDYTGRNVVTPSDVSVVSPVGGSLVRGRDFTVSFQYFDNWEESWSDTDEVIDGGKYRAVVRGAGKYASATRFQALEFDIRVVERAVGSIVTVNVPLVRGDGTETSIACRFRVTAIGDRRVVEAYGMRGTPCVAGDLLANHGAVTIPATVRSGGIAYHVEGLSSYAFYGCSQLTGIELPSSVASAGASAFWGCSSLASFAWPARVAAVPEHAFENCTALASVELPEGVESMGAYAFSGCASLASLELPSTLASAGQRAFYGTSSLETLVLPATLTEFGDAFIGSGLKSVAFAEGTVSICDAALRQASALASVELPRSLVSIGADAFASTGLARLVLPAGVETIGDGAFSRCAQLGSVVFEGNPNNIVAPGAFANTRYIRAVVYRAEELIDPLDFFATLPDDVGYYFAVGFYASPEAREAGTALGTAFMRRDVALYSITAGVAPEGVVFEGAIPCLPEGATAWVFADGRPISDAIGGACALVAAPVDFSDLSTGCVVTAGAYRYTGATVNPINDNTGFVVAGDGTRLRRGFDYTVAYERLDESGAWTATDDYASPGDVRIVASAIEGTGRTGTAVGYYTITKSLAGDTFTVADVGGHAITYQITEPAVYGRLGAVCVGANGAQAVAEKCAGHVVIPEVAVSPAGESYAVTEIGREAFYRRMQVTGVTVPASVTAIHSRAFAYERVKTDTATSNLATIVLEGDMERTSFGRDLFLNCDVVRSLVYGGPKGRLERIDPITVKAGVTLTRYFTVRFYADELAWASGAEPVAVARLREGCYAESASATDYFEGSDAVPFADAGFGWVFSGGVDSEGTIFDSCSAYQAESLDGTVVAVADLTAPDGTRSQVPCAFTVISDVGEGGGLGKVSVGRLEDGRPAIDAASAGALEIPEVVRAGNRSFSVAEVGLCAFGSSEDGLACAHITSVVLPPSVERIGQGAFMNCAALGRVDGLAESALAEIGAYAFAYCPLLSQVDLPEGLAAVGDGAFRSTGIARLVAPSTVETVGRAAFSGCEALREVVFSGAWGLELPALEGLDGGAGALVAGETDATCSALSSVGDYAFSGCPALERVVFLLDAGGVELPRDSFSQDGALSTVVFSGTAADVSQVAEIAAADVFYTIGYFASEEELGGPVRCGWRVLGAGCAESDEPLAAAEPELADYWEWVRLFDAGAPLAGSAQAYARPITYAIDVAPDDPALACAVTVGGVALDGSSGFGAHHADQVSVAVSTESALELGGLTVSDAESGAVIAASDEPRVTFDMPGGDVRVEVAFERALSVTGERATGGEVGAVAFTFAQMDALAQGRAPETFSYWKQERPFAVTTDAYVPLSELVDAAGLRFDAGDALIVKTAGGSTATFTYEDLCDEARSTFPGIADMGTGGAEPIAPAVALRAAVTDYDDETADELSLGPCYQLLAGQTEREMLKMRDTSENLPSQVVGLTVLYGPEHLEDCDVSGLGGPYYYSGSAVEPKPTVTDIDGNVLAQGRDYRVSYDDNVEAGWGRVTIQGIGGYDGEAGAAFPIRRAQVLAGATAPDSSAAVAAAGWPEGAAGAVVASADDYAGTLSASSLAGALGYPLLLARGSSLTASVADGLGVLSQGRKKFEVIVVGGTSAVSAGVYRQLGQYVSSSNYLTRISGADKYATSLAVYDYGARRKAWRSDVAVLTATGSAEAIPLAAFAAREAAPIVVCDGETLSASAAKRFATGGFSQVVVAGTAQVVKSAPVNAVAKALGSSSRVKRLSGASATAACTRIVAWERGRGMTFDGAAVASATRFGEALSAGVMCGRAGAVLLLSDGSDATALSALKGQEAARLFVAGGGKSVPASVRTAALSALGWTSAALGSASALSKVASYPTDKAVTLSRTSLSGAGVTVAKAVYTGKNVTPAVTVKLSGKTLVKGDDFTVAYSNNKNVSSKARVTVTGVGTYKGTVSKAFSISKRANPMAVKAGAKQYSVKQGVNATFGRAKVFKFTQAAKGAVTYSKVSGNKKITVGKSGSLSVKAGLAKGAYAVKVRVRAAGTATYAAKATVVTLKVRVK